MLSGGNHGRFCPVNRQLVSLIELSGVPWNYKRLNVFRQTLSDGLTAVQLGIDLRSEEQRQVG